MLSSKKMSFYFSLLALIVGTVIIVSPSLSYAIDDVLETETIAHESTPETINPNSSSAETAAMDTSEYLSTAVLEHSFAHGPKTNFDHIAPMTYNPETQTYWTVDGGTSPSFVYEYREDGTIATASTVPLSGRAIVYRPQDGEIYLAGYRGNVYRLNQPVDGTVTPLYFGLLQYSQNGFAFTSEGNFLTVYNGRVEEYDFYTGAIVRSFYLQPNYPSGTKYPYNIQIGTDGNDLYFFSAHDDIYVYDNNGIYKTTVDLNHPSLDNFNAPFSLAYTNERIYVHDVTDHTMYGYRIKVNTILVDIDIKPGSDPNCFNQNEHGVLPIAIFGGAELDVRDINVLSLSLQGLSVKLAGKSENYLAHYDYVDADTYLDLVVQFQDSDGWIEPGDDYAMLTGQLSDGTPIEGSDTICIVP